MGRVVQWVLTLALAAAVGLAGVRLERLDAGRATQDSLMYLPNGRYLKFASLGFDSLMADVMYLWAIQYYADYERGDRKRYVEHVFGSVIAELDPHYIDPYWMGALILIVEERDLEAGLRLLDLGFSRNPREWVLPYLAGWECYNAGQIARSAGYFARAAEVPDAPAQVLRMRAGVVGRAGDVEQAIRLWQEVLDDPRSDAASAAIAKRQIRKLRAQHDLNRLRDAVDRFRADNGRWPNSLAELARRSYVDVSNDPSTLDRFGYDPQTGRVESIAGRVLGGQR